MELMRAMMNQLEVVADLMQRVTEALSAQGILQWDEHYPNRAFLKEAIRDGNLYVFVVEGSLIGSVVLDEWQAPEWRAIAWRPIELPILVVHALAIDPRWQGQRYGTALLRACEQLAADEGYGSLRLDVFEGNPAARCLYEHHGYHRCGQIQFRSKPAGHQLYACYEKIFAS
jgi:ribosomal protein S18 acetylase RimI-like enzyme